MWSFLIKIHCSLPKQVPFCRKKLISAEIQVFLHFCRKSVWTRNIFLPDKPEDYSAEFFGRIIIRSNTTGSCLAKHTSLLVHLCLVSTHGSKNEQKGTLTSPCPLPGERDESSDGEKLEAYFHILRSRSNKMLSRMHSFLLSRRNIHFRVALAISPLLPRRVGEGARARASSHHAPASRARSRSVTPSTSRRSHVRRPSGRVSVFPSGRLASLAFVRVVRPSDTAKVHPSVRR